MSNPIDVVLTNAEILQGAMIGIMRQTQNIKLSRQRPDGNDDDLDWQWHVEGALGEMAVSKHYGVYHSGAFAFKGRDVGRFQVRTRARHHYELPIHKEDDDEDIFILVTGRCGVYKLQGWILCADGKRQEYWANPAKMRPAYFVPQDALNDMSQL